MYKANPKRSDMVTVLSLAVGQQDFEAADPHAQQSIS